MQRIVRARAARVDGGTRDQHSARSSRNWSDEYRPNTARASDKSGNSRVNEGVAARRKKRMRGQGAEMNVAHRTTPRSPGGGSAASMRASGPENDHPRTK